MQVQGVEDVCNWEQDSKTWHMGGGGRWDPNCLSDRILLEEVGDVCRAVDFAAETQARSHRVGFQLLCSGCTDVDP